MIKVLINDYLLDLSNIALNIVEKNNIFRDKITKTYSLPFYLNLTEDIGKALGMINISNIEDYETHTAVKVISNNNYYNGTFKISKIEGLKASVTLLYGSENLPVYEKQLKELPFEIINTIDLRAYAKTQILKNWPDATHNFVTVTNNDISADTNYDAFEGFVNNYEDDAFKINTSTTIDTKEVYYNVNVMVPMPYIMEILKVGYAQEKLTLKGSFVDDTFNHKIVHVPDNYLEKFSMFQYQIYSFKNNTQKYIADNRVISEFSKTHNVASLGSYKLKFSINLNEIIAANFELKIKLGPQIIYEATSLNEEINIAEDLTINIDADSEYTQLSIVLKLNEQSESIEAFNLFEFEFQEGKLNVFPDTFNLANFMPDCTFKEYVDAIANLCNLDVDIIDNIVYLNYIETSMPNMVYDDHSAFEVPNPPREINKAKVFKLKYDDGSELSVNKNGIVYNSNVDDDDLTTIDIPVIPLKVIDNEGKITAETTSDYTTLKLCLYNGLVNNKPLAVENINGRSLSISNIHSLFWKNWLHFRTNSEIYEDTFFAHVDSVFKISKGSSKYKKKHIIKEISKKSVNKKYNKVKIISETL